MAWIRGSILPGSEEVTVPAIHPALGMVPTMLRVRALAAPVALVALLHSANARATVLIDFDTYPGGAPVPPGATIGDQWKSLGVVFSDGAGGPAGASNNNCSISAPNHAYATPIVATFVDPVTLGPALTDYVGASQDYCWVPGEGIDMRAYDLAGHLIASTFNPPGSVNGSGRFEAFSFPTAVIARVEFHCVAQGIDNFEFGAPTVAGIAPAPVEFALRRVANPASGARLDVAFALPDAGAARLELLDVRGRRVASREVGELGAGNHEVRLEPRHRLAPGVYFVRLVQARNSAVRRVTVLE